MALGGLISRNDAKSENKVPWLGDLPYIGAAFRYRTQVKSKTELLVILTPHVVRNRMEADRVLAEEAARMDWMVDDVTRYHGLSGMDPVLHPQQYQLPLPTGEVDGTLPSPLDGPIVAPPVGTATTPPVGTETLPSPRPLPPGETIPPPVPGPASAAPVASPVQQASVVIPTPGAPARTPAPAVPAAPIAPPAPAAGLQGASQFMPQKW